MKIFRDIIFGIFIGTAVVAGIIFSNNYLTQKNYQADAYDIATNGFATEALANLGIAKLDYDDVFGSATYKNLYMMLLLSTSEKPQEDATRDLAQQYGLTLAEAEAAKGGSIDALLRSPKYATSQRTNQELNDIANQVVNDYNDKLEILTLKQDLAIVSADSEIFSNGDVTDSGFDLVHDLDVIEQLLFDTATPPTLGKPLTWGNKSKPDPSDSPYPPEGSEADPSTPLAYDKVKENDVGTSNAPLTAGDDNASNISLLGDENPPEKTTEDVCPSEDSALDEALSDYNDEQAAFYASQNDTNPNGEGNDGQKKNETGSGYAKELVNGITDLTPAKSDDWRTPLECNGTLWTGGTDLSVLNGEDAAGAASYYLCLEFSMKWQRYSSYVPVDNCIACELEKINAYLQKTLSNSLIPNKAPGNQGEISKCKGSLVLPLIDIRFITMWSPALTPPHDEAIYGKSVANEWDKFLKRNNPFGISSSGSNRLPEYNQELATKLAYDYATPDTNFSQLLQDINSIQAELTKDRVDNLEQFRIESQGQDFVTYSQDVMAEVKQMTMFFKNFTNMFKTLAEETCPALANKEYLD